MEMYESHISLDFSHSNWAEQRATVHSGKGKIDPRFALGRNGFLYFSVVHWWWIDQLTVVLSLVLKWVKKIEIQHPMCFYFSSSSSLSECGKGLPSLNQLVESKAQIVTDHFPSAVPALLWDCLFWMILKSHLSCPHSVCSSPWSSVCAVALKAWSSNVLHAYE